MESHTDRIIQIWAVRHGQTIANTKNMCQGHTGGQLTDLGVKQAAVLGKRLASEKFGICYVSDLARTKETFKVIIEQNSDNEAKELDVVYSPLLREKSGGVFEGNTLKALSDAAKRSKLPIRDYRPQEGECWNDVHKRAAELLLIVFYDVFVLKRPGKIF